ncbi:ATP-binding cassette domain-containing protein [Corynebacterium lubricantis]|uniref:ATP-binding cassette domain-containing protein n=1 Tax=Corynebacterium lubricantis TaxID=541095 RepID=UPI00036E6367|nr:ATP-binding cassette domain-containing protein [Corynebacterium lubricantis]
MDLTPLRAAMASSRNKTVQVVADSGQGLSRMARELHETLPNIGVVTQDAEAHVTLLRDTVIEEVATGLEQRGVEREEMLRRCTRTLEMCGLADLADRHPTQLSGGQTRRLAIATVAVLEPQIFVLDNPFAGLDPESSRAIVSLFREMPSEIVVLGNRVHRELGSSVLSLRDDSLSLHVPAPQEVSLPAPVAASIAAPIDLGSVSATRGGASRRWWQFKASTQPDFAVGPLPLVVSPSSVVWLRGANGSGKTTLLRAMAGLDGNDGVSVSTSLAFQHAADQVVDTTISGFIGDAGLISELDFDPEEHPLDLSASNLRLAQMASVYVQNRTLMLFDEPDVGLDTCGRTRAHEMLARCLSGGAALVMTCHDTSFMDEVGEYAQVSEVWV